MSSVIPFRAAPNFENFFYPTTWSDGSFLRCHLLAPIFKFTLLQLRSHNFTPNEIKANQFMFEVDWTGCFVNDARLKREKIRRQINNRCARINARQGLWNVSSSRRFSSSKVICKQFFPFFDTTKTIRPTTETSPLTFLSVSFDKFLSTICQSREN